MEIAARLSAPQRLQSKWSKRTHVKIWYYRACSSEESEKDATDVSTLGIIPLIAVLIKAGFSTMHAHLVRRNTHLTIIVHTLLHYRP